MRVPVTTTSSIWADWACAVCWACALAAAPATRIAANKGLALSGMAAQARALSFDSKELFLEPRYMCTPPSDCRLQQRTMPAAVRMKTSVGTYRFSMSPVLPPQGLSHTVPVVMPIMLLAAAESTEILL